MLKITAVGYIGQDARTNMVQDKRVINFSLAHTTKWKDKDGKEQSKTYWVECAYWTDRKVDEYLKKGTLVAIEGRPSAETYTDRNNVVQPKLSCTVDYLELLSSSKKEGGSQSNEQGNAGSSPPT
ncbi:single-stranded DNA-binding protein [Oscillatoria amoena NRMC-F 0135]|nr:single-stranded DNA-binding protein [Oscillatoria amoena NRMC-F 0135]